MADLEHTVTNLDIENEYPKLVRDQIPEIIKAEDGYDVPLRVLSESEFERYLRHKAIEEATELAEAKTEANLLEEIADLREIIDELEKLKGFTPEQVREVQDRKRKKRGGFNKRILMLSNEQLTDKDIE